MVTAHRSEDKEMTTILSSIRKMIVDDLNSTEHPPKRSDGEGSDMSNVPPIHGPAPLDDALPLTRLLKDDGSIVHLEDRDEKNTPPDQADTRVFYGFKPADPTKSPLSPGQGHDAYQTYGQNDPALTGQDQTPVDSQSTSTENPYFSDTWRPRPFQTDADFDTWTPPMTHTPFQETPETEQRATANDLWIDPAVQQKTKEAFDALIAARDKPVEAEKKPENSGTLDSFMRELLKPMIKEWLDQHLAAIVERQVQIQIDHLVGQLDEPRP